MKALQYGLLSTRLCTPIFSAKRVIDGGLHSHPTRLSDLSFQEDNAGPHVLAKTRQLLLARHLKTLYQAVHSSDFNLLDRWVNAHLKCNLQSCFFLAEQVEEAALQVLWQTPAERFLREIQKLKDHLQCHLQGR